MSLASCIARTGRFAAIALALAAAVANGASVTPPPVATRAYFLLDATSGRTLAAASEHDRFEPASLTKLMTAYVALGAIRDGKLALDRSVRISARAAGAGGSGMFASVGQSVTVQDLLRAMMVLSANDAAMALAEAVAGSEEAFVAQMNRQAERLGLGETRFANATGRPEAGHHSSARDLARIAAAIVVEFPEFTTVSALREFRFNGITQANRNRLLWADPTVDGLMNGFTEAAGYCLVASARRGERRLVSVVLGARSDGLRVAETQKLLNFGFQAYETRRLYRKGEPVATPAIYKGTRRTIRLGFDRDIWLTLPRGRFERLAAHVETRQPFVAPYAAGQKAGIMKLTRDKAAVAEFPLVALEDVPVAGFLSRGWDTLRLLLLR